MFIDLVFRGTILKLGSVDGMPGDAPEKRQEKIISIVKREPRKDE